MRTCVVCRQRRPDVDLVRAGRDVRGQWYRGRGVGRGVWWCSVGDCVSELTVARVSRALRGTVTQDEVTALVARPTSRG